LIAVTIHLNRTMKPVSPYQPLLLRLLHGITGLCLLLAIATAFWTYNLYDGRWGTLPLPDYRQIEGIHGTLGLYTLLIFPAFLVYACRRGQRRLWQAQTWKQLFQGQGKTGRPQWWYSLNRCTNTLTLIALLFALLSGKMMDDTWLPKGELNHAWYSAHLIAWVVMLLAIALHLLLNAKIGGAPLLLSMVPLKFRAKDAPSLWPEQVSAWWSHTNWRDRQTWLSQILPQSELERLAWLVLALAWLLPLLKV
jgi:uncharacterized membrane protein YhaH (DUF805 family)